MGTILPASAVSSFGEDYFVQVLVPTSSALQTVTRKVSMCVLERASRPNGLLFFFFLVLPVAKKCLKEAVKHTFVVLLSISMAARVTKVWPHRREVAAPKVRDSREVSQAGTSSDFQIKRGTLVTWALLGTVCARTHPWRDSLALEGALLAALFGSAGTWEVPCFAILAHRVEIRCLDKGWTSPCLRAGVSRAQNFGCFYGPNTARFIHRFYFFCSS